MAAEMSYWNINGNLCFFATQLQILRSAQEVQNVVNVLLLEPHITNIHLQIQDMINGDNLSDRIIRYVDSEMNYDYGWRRYDVPMLTYFISDQSRQDMRVSLQCLYPYIKTFARINRDIDNRELKYGEMNELNWLSVSWLPRILTEELAHWWRVRDSISLIAEFNGTLRFMHKLQGNWIHTPIQFNGSVAQPFDSIFLMTHYISNSQVLYGNLAIIPVAITNPNCTLNTVCALRSTDNKWYLYHLMAIVLKVGNHFILNHIAYNRHGVKSTIIDNGKTEEDDVTTFIQSHMQMGPVLIVGLVYERYGRPVQDDYTTAYQQFVTRENIESCSLLHQKDQILLSRMYRIRDNRIQSCMPHQIMQYNQLLRQMRETGLENIFRLIHNLS